MLMNSILFTIDVEDWFQVENYKSHIRFDTWPLYTLRVERNTLTLLDILETLGQCASVDSSTGFRWNDCSGTCGLPATSSRKYPHNMRPKATFFVLGWVAKRLPKLIREIHDRGHEVASHGFFHNLCNQCSHEELYADLSESRKLLEDITGAPILGYRAPSFSINRDVLKVIEAAGYYYDSSYNSFSLHDRYGQIDLPRNGRQGIAHKLSDKFYELPISNVSVGGRALPVGGGGYFRLIPVHIFKRIVRTILSQQGAYLFYIHPWEVDPGQPRVKEASKLHTFRHRVSLGKAVRKLSVFLDAFKQERFITCSQYLHENDSHQPKNTSETTKSEYRG